MAYAIYADSGAVISKSPEQHRKMAVVIATMSKIIYLRTAGVQDAAGSFSVDAAGHRG